LDSSPIQIRAAYLGSISPGIEGRPAAAQIKRRPDSQSDPRPNGAAPPFSLVPYAPGAPPRPIRTRSKPPGFVLPCQPALSDRPPTGPDWQHEIKWDGYRVIARKDGQRVRLWARTMSDYPTPSRASRRRRSAAHTALIDGEAIVLRSRNRLPSVLHRMQISSVTRPLPRLSSRRVNAPARQWHLLAGVFPSAKFTMTRSTGFGLFAIIAALLAYVASLSFLSS
jgi:hypothetical protein